MQLKPSLKSTETVHHVSDKGMSTVVIKTLTLRVILLKGNIKGCLKLLGKH